MQISKFVRRNFLRQARTKRVSLTGRIKMNSELNFFERWMPPSIGSRVRFRRRITRNIKPLLFTWRKKKRSKIILVSRVNGGKN